MLYRGFQDSLDWWCGRVGFLLIKPRALTWPYKNVLVIISQILITLSYRALVKTSINDSTEHLNTNMSPSELVNGAQANGSTPAPVRTHSASNGAGQGETNHSAKSDTPEYQIPLWDAPSYSIPRKLRIITIGAGFSGLTFAYKLRYEHPEMEKIVINTIFESRSDIGGTWLVNTYPGVQCDVPSHIYAFPFDPNPNWNHYYSTGAEIEDYIQKTVKKWDLDRDVQLNSKVVGLHWQDQLGQWKVTVEHNGIQRVEYADIVISAQGFLNSWKWPNIPGLHNFKGHKVHSAAWDHSYDYSHKRIGIVGNGSSGIQILPQMAMLEGTEVISFQRSPTWVVSRTDPGKLLGRPNSGPNPAYTEEEQERFREEPEAHHKYRKSLIHAFNKGFNMVSEYLALTEFNSR